jgi:hypothetical protein
MLAPEMLRKELSRKNTHRKVKLRKKLEKRRKTRITESMTRTLTLVELNKTTSRAELGRS